jgi:predicted transcriptional regulator
MRKLGLALGLIAMVSISGAALAADPGALPALPPLGLPAQEQQIHEVTALAEQAAGIAPAPAEVPPVFAPVAPGDLDLSGVTLLGVAALGLAGLASLAWLWLGARFSTPAEVLQNDVRQRIYAYLKERVGANLKQVTDDLALTTTNAIWHLRKLEESGLIHSKRFNGYKVFYPAEGGIEARRLSLGKTALQNGNAQEVFELVVAQPGIHQREIARALGVNHGTVRWHLKKLLHAELILETRRGKASAYEPTPIGLTSLREVAAHKAVAAPVAPVVTAA